MKKILFFLLVILIIIPYLKAKDGEELLTDPIEKNVLDQITVTPVFSASPQTCIKSSNNNCANSNPAYLYPDSNLTLFIQTEIQGLSEYLEEKLKVSEEEEEEEEETPENSIEPEEEAEEETLLDITLTYQNTNSDLSCSSPLSQTKGAVNNQNILFTIECQIGSNPQNLITPPNNFSFLIKYQDEEREEQKTLSFNNVYTDYLLYQEPEINLDFSVNLTQDKRSLFNGVTNKQGQIIQRKNRTSNSTVKASKQSLNNKSNTFSQDNFDETNSLLDLYVSPAPSQKRIYPKHQKESGETIDYGAIGKYTYDKNFSYYNRWLYINNIYFYLNYKNQNYNRRYCYSRKNRKHCSYYGESIKLNNKLFLLIEKKDIKINNYFPEDTLPYDLFLNYKLIHQSDYYSCDDGKREVIGNLNYAYDVPVNENSTPLETHIVYFYNQKNPQVDEVWHLSDLKSAPVELNLEIILPHAYPSLYLENPHCNNSPSYTGKNNFEISYPKNCNTDNQDYHLQSIIKLKDPLNPSSYLDANHFVKNGGSFFLPRDIYQNLDFSAYAQKIGKGGFIKTKVQGKVLESKWEYKKVGEMNLDFYNIYQRLNGTYRCSTSYRREHKIYSINLYKWIKTDEELVDYPETISQTPVDVYSSSAWIQTKGGHMGTNNTVKSEGNEDNKIFLRKYNTQTQTDEEATYYTAPKNYSPENETNAEFMIYAKKTAQNQYDHTQEFSSEAGWYQELNSQEESKYGYKLQGKEYDKGTYLRDYEEDLLNREIFGEVIDFSKLCNNLTDYECNQIISEYGVRKNNQNYYITKEISLKKSHIYYFKEGNLYLGELNQDLYLKGYSARIKVKNNVYIRGNIFYANQKAENFLEVPSLRLDAKTVYVNKDTEFIETQINCHNFHSGKSSTPLKILGDLIADNIYFERKPVNIYNPEDYSLNPPSEMIIEDYRKFLIPAPGDTILRDSDTYWQQVNPSTGETIDPY